MSSKQTGGIWLAFAPSNDGGAGSISCRLARMPLINRHYSHEFIQFVNAQV